MLRAAIKAGLVERVDDDAFRVTEKGLAMGDRKYHDLVPFRPVDITIKVTTVEQDSWVRCELLPMLADRGISSREDLASERRRR
jgi:hypothetical protein